MQGRLLDEMSKFTKIGVATPKYQIQNNFQVRNFNFKSQTRKLPPPHQAWSPVGINYWYKLTEGTSLTQWAILNYTTENTKTKQKKQNKTKKPTTETKH